MDKNILTRIGETIDQYRADRRAASVNEAAPQLKRPSRLRRILRWWMPNPGTLVLVLALLFAVPALARNAAAPAASSVTTIPYQGRLADINGNPVTDRVNMVFRLYDVPTGGTPLWTEYWTGSDAVNVSDGLFSVMLGSLNPTLVETVQGHDELYLEITVGTDNPMTPRVQLGSVPFSVLSLTVADGSITAAKIATGAVGSDAIADGAVGAAEIATDAVGSDEIAANAVGSDEIAANAVHSDEIAAGSVTSQELAQHSASQVHFASANSAPYLTTDGQWHDDPALSITANFFGGDVLIELNSPGTWCDTHNKAIDTRILVDDAEVAKARTSFQVDGGYAERQTSIQWFQTLSPGTHSIRVQWRAASGINTARIGMYSTRTLTVVELKR